MRTIKLSLVLGFVAKELTSNVDVVRTLIKLNYRNQWLEELKMTRKQNSTELSRTMLTQEVPEA